MKTFEIQNKIVYKHSYNYESSYRNKLSELLIKRYGRKTFDKKEAVRDPLIFSLKFFIKSFKFICNQEKLNISGNMYT